jgi:membrane protease YdiL (CAAX protease family)
VVGIGLLIVELIILRFQSVFVGHHAGIWTSVLATHHGPAAYVLDTAQGALISPVAEELLFRGLLFTALVQRVPVWVATIVSALIFAAVHFEPYSFVALFAVGVGLALLFYRTRNLWLTVTAHGTVNFIIFSLYFLRHP